MRRVIFLALFMSSVSSAGAGEELCPYVPVEGLDGQAADPVRPDHDCARLFRELAFGEPAIEAEGDSADDEGGQAEQTANQVVGWRDNPQLKRCVALTSRGRFSLGSDLSASRLPAGFAAPAFPLVRPSSGKDTGTIAYNAVEFTGCGTHFPVIVSTSRSVDSFYRSPDGRYLIAVSTAAHVPFGNHPKALTGIVFFVLDLKTSRTATIPVPKDGASIAVAVSRSGQLMVRIYDSQDGGLMVLRCNLAHKSCKLREVLALHEFPESDFLLQTAAGAHRIAPRPKTAPPLKNSEGRVVARKSMQFSPDAKWMTYVSSEDLNHFPSRDEPSGPRQHFLHLRNLSTGSDRVVDQGWGWMNVEWVSNTHFLYNANPAFTPATKKLLEQYQDTQLGSDASTEIIPPSVALALNIDAALSALQQSAPREIQTEGIVRFDVLSGKHEPLSQNPHEALYSSFFFTSSICHDVDED